MKYCPQCQEQFGDELSFCDIDGSPLVDHIGSVRGGLREGSDSRGPGNRISSTPIYVTALIGTLIGIVLWAVFLAFFRPAVNSVESPTLNRENDSARTAAPAPLKQIAAAPLTAPSPTAEESASPEETEASTDTAPATTPETLPKTAVNQGPISTGATRVTEERTLITMKDGSSIEADAAWEDADGFWYRRGGLVSFVDSSKVAKLSALGNRSASAEAAKP